MVWGYYGQSWFILGSEDIRRGGGLAVQYVRHEPRFKFWGKEGQLVFEGNVTHTVGGNKFEWEGDTTIAFGVLALARYETRPKKGLSTYLEGGWGLQWADKHTIDLPSHFNSTPVLGAGIILPIKGHDLYLGVRYIHISNAGTVGNNAGQNQVLFMAGIKF